MRKISKRHATKASSKTEQLPNETHANGTNNQSASVLKRQRSYSRRKQAMLTNTRSKKDIDAQNRKSPTIANAIAENKKTIMHASQLRDSLTIDQSILDACNECLIDEDHAIEEDNRRSVVLQRTMPKLACRLAADEASYTCASFRFHRTAREAIVPVVAALFYDDDFPTAKITLKDLGASYPIGEHKDHGPKIDIKPFRQFIKKHFGDCRRGSIFGVLEYSLNRHIVSPHMHLVASGDYLEVLRVLKKKGGNGFNIDIRKLSGGDKDIPQSSTTRGSIHAVSRYLDYMLKGATYTKSFRKPDNEDVTHSPKISDETVLLKAKHKISINECVIFGNLHELRHVFGGFSDMSNVQKFNGDKLRKGTEINSNSVLKASRGQLHVSNICRLTLPQIYDVDNLTCQNLSEKMTSEKTWGHANISNLHRIAKGKVDTGEDCYLLNFVDGSNKLTIHDLASRHNGLLQAMVVVGVKLFKSSTRSQIFDLAEKLDYSFDVARKMQGGFSQQQKCYEYNLPDGTVIGAGNNFSPRLSLEHTSKKSLRRQGSLEEWSNIVAPIITERPVAIAILGQALLPIVRSIKKTKAAYAQQATLTLFGDTSTGKSTVAMAIAAAVWNDPARTPSLNQTVNNVMGLIEDNSGICMVLDEATLLGDNQQGKKEAMTKIIHAVADGRDKGRQTDKIKSSVKHILSAILTSNESGKELKTGSAAVAGGVTVRNPCLIFNKLESIINVINNDVSTTFKDLQRASETHFGLVGPILASLVSEALSSDYENTVNQLDAFFHNFNQGLKAQINEPVDYNNGTVMRMADQFAAQYSILAFGQLVGIFPRGLWGDFLRPLQSVCLMALQEAQLIGQKKKTALTLAGKQKTIATRLRKLQAKKPHRFKFIDQMKLELMTDKQTNSIVFYGYNKKLATHFVAVKSERLLQQILKGYSAQDFRQLRKLGLFHATKSSSNKANFSIRLQKNGKAKHYDDCYLLKFKVSPLSNK